MPIAIIACACTHAFQDKLYGLGMRVHNWAVRLNNKQGGWRCTVCRREKPANAAKGEQDGA